MLGGGRPGPTAAPPPGRATAAHWLPWTPQTPSPPRWQNCYAWAAGPVGGKERAVTLCGDETHPAGEGAHMRSRPRPIAVQKLPQQFGHEGRVPYLVVGPLFG